MRYSIKINITEYRIIYCFTFRSSSNLLPPTFFGIANKKLLMLQIMIHNMRVCKMLATPFLPMPDILGILSYIPF